jgi:HlyD family secretion protein
MYTKLKNELILYPGMPADVFIITGSRSLLNYIFAPILESSYKAFRED